MYNDYVLHHEPASRLTEEQIRKFLDLLPVKFIVIDRDNPTVTFGSLVFGPVEVLATGLANGRSIRIQPPEGKRIAAVLTTSQGTAHDEAFWGVLRPRTLLARFDGSIGNIYAFRPSQLGLTPTAPDEEWYLYLLNHHPCQSTVHALEEQRAG